MPVVSGDLLVPGPSTAEVVLQGVGCRGRQLGLGWRRPLVVLDDAVLSRYGPFLGRVGLGLGLGLRLGRGKHRRIVQLGRLVLQL